MGTIYQSFTDYIYIRVTVIIWIKNGLASIGSLSKDSGDTLVKLYNEVEPIKPIVLDFHGVTNIIDHSWDYLFVEIEKQKRPVVFLNSSQISSKIFNSHKELCPTSTYSDNQNIIYVATQPNFEFNATYSQEVKNKLLSNVKQYIRSSFHAHPNGEMRLLPSTPFYANGEYTATKIISQAESFVWTSIFLADFIEKKISDNKVGADSRFPIRLLSVSLRSSPFASSVSLILNYPLQTIEYLGPNRNSTYINSNVKLGQYEYIYIGDFSFAGTEIRITKMYASLSNSRLSHAFVLGSLMPPEAFNDFNLHSLTNLHEVNNLAKYQLFKP